MIVNTGSKQGITNPPGNAAYNASKAAVKSLTENLAFELRQVPNTKLTAHLFMYVPSLLSSFTFFGLVLHADIYYMYMIQTRLDTHLHLYLWSHARLVHAAAWRMVRVGDGTIHARQGALGHVLHPVPGRRDAAGGRPAAHPVGRGRPDGGPPRAEPLAPGLEEPIRGVDARGVGGAVRHGVVYDGFRVSVERV